MTSIYETIQQSELGKRVNLYQLNLNAIGVNEIWKFTDTPSGDLGYVDFGGERYSAADIDVSGFEWTGQGTLPRPKIKVSNTNNLLVGTLLRNNNLIGCKFVRLRTFEKFLDNGSEPNPEAILNPDIYTVTAKTHHDKYYIEWELSSAMDCQGIMVPRRNFYKNNCQWKYRMWNQDTLSWNYAEATCPYSGFNMFDYKDDATTDPTKDVCSHALSGCIKRFGRTAELPFGGFPGVGISKVGG